MAQLFSEMFDQPETSSGQLHPDLDALIRKPFDEKFIRAIMSPDIRVWNKYALGDEKPTLGEVFFPWTRSERFYQAEQMRNMFQQHATSLMMTGDIAHGLPRGSVTSAQPGTPGTLANPNESFSLAPPGIPQGSGIQGPGPGIPINPGALSQPTKLWGRPIDPGQEALARGIMAPGRAWLQAGIPPPERMIGIPEQQAALGFEQGTPTGPVTESTVRGAISGFGATQREKMREGARQELETQRETARAHENELYKLTHQEQLERIRMMKIQHDRIEADRREAIIRSQFKSDRHSDILRTGNAGILIPDGQGGYTPDMANLMTNMKDPEKLRKAYGSRLVNAERRGDQLEARLWRDELATIPETNAPASTVPSATGKAQKDDFPGAPRGKAVGALLKDKSGKLVATWDGSRWIKVPVGAK